MARKRGGLAGLWDRNKNILKPLATGVAGALTGGLGAAALGAAMGGLDRPGKGGIGVDLGGAAKGALAGYGTGAVGAGLKGGIQSAMGAGEGGTLGRLFTGAKGGMREYGAGLGKAGEKVFGTATTTPGPKGEVTRRLGGMFGADTGLGEAARGIGQFAKTYAQPLGQAASAIAEYGVGQQQADIARERNRLERERFDREREQQEALAELLMPVFQSQAQRVGRMG